MSNPTAPEFDFLIFTDGSGHPDGYGGWAATAIETATNRRMFRMGGQSGTSVERMELTALIEGLLMCAELGRLSLQSDPGRMYPRRTALWRSDRESLVKTIAGEYRRSTEPDLWKRLDVVLARFAVTAEHVSRENDFPEFGPVDLHASSARIMMKSYTLSAEMPAPCLPYDKP